MIKLSRLDAEPARSSLRARKAPCWGLVLAAAGALSCQDDTEPPSVPSQPAPDPVPIAVTDDRDVATLANGAECAGQTQALEATPVSLYLMLDSSSSMNDETLGGQTKWEAVQSAALSFVRQSSNDDVSLGIQFFPSAKPDSRFFCRSNEDCGPSGGPCFLNTCSAGSQVELCYDSGDCPGRTNQCIRFGVCENDESVACPLGFPCGDVGTEGYLGLCVNIERRECTQAVSCDSARYAQPAVEIAPLTDQGQAGLIATTLQGRQLVGETPTAPALEGAIAHATDWAGTHRNEQVVAVMVTDGTPTLCAPQDIGSLAQIAAAGFSQGNGIRTFVIGVFRPGEVQAVSDLNQLAAAGGTDEALFIDASGNVEQQFLTALQRVRSEAFQCDFALPTDQDDLDLFAVNVSFDDGQTPQALSYVGDLAGCGVNPDGWFYDTDPNVGQPSRISVCPTVCDRARASSAGSLNLQLGCATVPGIIR